MIPFINLQKINQSFQPELGEAVMRVMESGWYVRGGELRRFEEEYASFTGTAHCVGVGNGFDALRLIFRAWLAMGLVQEGDEVILPANTYIACLLAISDNRLRPVLVEPDIRTFEINPRRIEEAISPRTKAIMVVHLYGRNAMHEEVITIATKYNLKIVEDNAQAAGCRWHARRTGSLGDAAAHSFFPSKNLGGLGDGGAVTTNDKALAETIRTLGNYGSQEKYLNDLQGVNSRLDDIQAAALRVKLRRLDEDNARRREVAQFYLDRIAHPLVLLPAMVSPSSREENVWHLFVIRTTHRDLLKQHLEENGIETLVHYPIPPHRQRAYTALAGMSLPVTEQIHREVLSLPLSPVMERSELERVVAAVNECARMLPRG
jgi:dTDP-4-amino-4,6-dideoxygalactose transaminase